MMLEKKFRNLVDASGNFPVQILRVDIQQSAAVVVYGVQQHAHRVHVALHAAAPACDVLRRVVRRVALRRGWQRAVPVLAYVLWLEEKVLKALMMKILHVIMH